MITNRVYWITILAILLLWLACALLWPFPLRAALDPQFSARWDSKDSATIQWTQPGRACLSVAHADGSGVFIGCYNRVGTITLALGGPQTDGAYRPRSGDVYCVAGVGCAPLIGRPVYLTAVRR